MRTRTKNPVAARARVFLLALTIALLLGDAGSVRAAAGVGDVAPVFSLSSWDGGRVSLAEFRGKVVLLDFWATWCVACAKALPAVDELARRYAPAGLATIAVNIDGARPTAERFLAERLPKTAMTLLHDPKGEVLARFGASGMPALYVIDRDGVVRVAEGGYALDRIESVEREIEALLPKRD